MFGGEPVFWIGASEEALWFAVGSGECFLELTQLIDNVSERKALPNETISGIEADHFDCFESIEDAVDAFAEFVALIPKDGRLLIDSQTHGIETLRSRCRSGIETFSTNQPADWTARSLQVRRSRTQIEIRHRDRVWCQFELAIPGRHNIENSLAAAVTAHAMGVSADAVRRGMEGFRGVKRRFEVLGNRHDATFVDDYAHHPTRIEATLQAARQRFGNRRLGMGEFVQQAHPDEPSVLKRWLCLGIAFAWDLKVKQTTSYPQSG